MLTIIKAHPAPGEDGQDYERLRAAMSALTGRGETKDSDADMGAAVDWMARERQRDLCDRDMKALSGFEHLPVRTVHELSMLAAYEFQQLDDLAEVHASAELLCAAFESHRRLMPLSGCDAEREALEGEAVERICAELAEWDAQSRL